MMTESQKSVAAWSDQTFGPALSNMRIAVRAEELAALLRILAIRDDHPDAAERTADVVVTLLRLSERLGVELSREIDKRMEAQKKIAWEIDGSGCGYEKNGNTP